MNELPISVWMQEIEELGRLTKAERPARSFLADRPPWDGVPRIEDSLELRPEKMTPELRARLADLINRLTLRRTAAERSGADRPPPASLRAVRTRRYRPLKVWRRRSGGPA